VVREPACISDYAGDSLAALRATHTKEVLSKGLGTRLTSSTCKNCFQTLATERPWLKNKLKRPQKKQQHYPSKSLTAVIYIS